jgi:GT2 family glycosyltransferase
LNEVERVHPLSIGYWGCCVDFFGEVAQKSMNNDILDALAQSHHARAAGNLELSQEWLEHARRIAPNNSMVRLTLAAVMLDRGLPEALELIKNTQNKDDIREASLALAILNLRLGEPGLAAEVLGRSLSQHAHSIPELSPIADAVVRDTNALGWCALDGAGGLVVYVLPTASSHERPTADLDGRPIALRRQNGDGVLIGRLPREWESGQTVTVAAGNTALLGSPIAVNRIVRLEGFVDSRDGDIHGWAWCPNNPDRDPVLSIVALNGNRSLSVVADDDTLKVASAEPFSRPRGFRVSATQLQGIVGPVRVLGRDGRNLTGSPLDPTAERISAERSSRAIAHLFPAQAQKTSKMPALVPLPGVPAHIVGGPPLGGTKRRPVDVVVPVYGGLDLTLACLESVLADLPKWARVVVVDDASPDPTVGETLGHMARQRRIVLRTQLENRGFPSTANVGMRQDPSRDVVLLNSDTLVPPGWLHRLREVAYSAPAIGTVTPLSNDAEILGYPTTDQANAIPGLAETIQLDALAQQANAGITVDIPTAVGFCMYIKRDCLTETGLFREDQFGQGYGEENDFCIRGRHLGWRHVAAPGIFVAHVGGQSFRAAKGYLVGRNIRIINRLHPGYDALIQEFLRADPISESRKRLDIERWKLLRSRRKSVLLVTHGRGGGVQRRVAERAQALRSEGLRPIVIWPVGRRDGKGRDCVLGDGPEGGTPNLRFHVPEELGQLARLLKADRPIRAEVHHLIGHDHAILDLFAQLQIPYEVVIHDYSWLCPRINLVGAERRYCGEPDVGHCEMCVDDAGTTNDENTRPRALRDRSEIELNRASRIVVPSQDVATRIKRHFPLILPQIESWEDDSDIRVPAFPPSRDDEVRVCVIGAIGIEKGYDILLACARDAAERKLPVAFRLVGYSCDDRRLLATGRVHITGRYGEHEAIALIQAQGAQMAWLPSIWPETWCYTLTQAWNGGLNTAAFDIGTPADRIRQWGRGWLFPLGIPPAALNNQFMRLALSLVPAHLERQSEPDRLAGG